jgi:hypothetical protein
MAETTSFTGLTCKKVSRGAKNGSANFTAALSAAIIKKMEWDDIRDYEKGVQLEGELAAQTITLGAAGTLLTWTVDFEATKVANFQSVRREIEGKRGKGYRHELHFVVTFSDPAGARYLEEYMQSVPVGKGTMTVYHSAPQPKQQNLVGDAQADPDVQTELLKN